MKKGLHILIILLMLWVGQGSAKSNNENVTPEQAIRSSLRSTQISSIQSTPIKGLYQIVAGKNVFYSGPKGRYLFIGHIYDTVTQTDITEKIKESLIPKQIIKWSTLPKKAAVIANPGAKLKMAVFLDPDCPYCRALESVLSKSNDIQAHYYLYPLASLHENAPYQSEQIWCSQNQYQALKTIMSGKALSMRPDCDSSALANIKVFGDQYHINVTPTLIRDDGQVTYGYMTRDKLLKWLKASTVRNAS